MKKHFKFRRSATQLARKFFNIKKKYIVIETTNGEGYSSPQIIKTENKNIIFELIKKHKNNLFDFSKEIKNNDLDYTFIYNNEYDASRIQILILPNFDYNLLEIKPDINEAKFIGGFDNKKYALRELKIYINNGNFEQDDINHYNNEDIFASHDENEGFIYYKIIENI